MIYTVLLLIGLFGILVLALLGMAHGGQAHLTHSGHGHAAIGHGGQAQLGHAGHGHQVGSARAHSQHQQQTQTQQGSKWPLLWSLLSPMALFSLCLGGGATGLALHHLHLPEPLTALASTAGAFVFYGMIVRPLSQFIFQFASQPSRALEGAISQTAKALTHFDTSGKGLVQLVVDGQLVRIIAILEPEETRTAVAIEPGDQLLVTGVDGQANSCRVTRL